MGAQGSAVVDFGAGADHASVTITGQTAYVGPGTNLVEAWIDPMNATILATGRTQDEHILGEALTDVTCANPVAGVGFDIVIVSSSGMTFGKFAVAWVWN